MKELIIEATLIDHTTKSKSVLLYCIKLDWNQNYTHEMLHPIKEAAKAQLAPHLQGYRLVCDQDKLNEKKVLVDGVMKQVKYVKVCCMKLVKGELAPVNGVCMPGEVHKYAWRGKTVFHGEYKNGMIQPKAEKTGQLQMVQPGMQQMAQPFYEQPLNAQYPAMMQQQVQNPFAVPQAVQNPFGQQMGGGNGKEYKLKYLGY